MLSVASDAPTDEIKKAFRREIARYHPDKVQHLGQEFQEMAASIAADLTEAYRILMDPGLRAKYDAEMKDGGARRVAPPAPPRPPAPPVDVPPAPGPTGPSAGPTRPRPTAGIDFVRRVTLSKLRTAVEEVLPHAEPLTAAGFDIAVVTKPKKSLFKKTDDSICLLIKFVALVDPQAIADLWPVASRMKAPGAGNCTLVLAGSGMA